MTAMMTIVVASIARIDHTLHRDDARGDERHQHAQTTRDASRRRGRRVDRPPYTHAAITSDS